MLLFYLVFLVVTLAIGYLLFRKGQKLAARTKTGIHMAVVVSAGFLLLETIVWAYMMLVTIDAMLIEFSPGKPKPYFLISWGLGIAGYGMLAFLQAPIDAFLKRRFDEQSPDHS